MAEGKQRSGLFKFLYIVLSVITFPIFAVLFILRHPLWVLFLLCLGAGGAVYYPMSQGSHRPEPLTQLNKTEWRISIQENHYLSLEQAMKDF